jgi:lipoate-protein ligase A
MTTWRLIPYAEFDGATNMAVDEAILEAHVNGLVPPTLRVYGFVPPCVTIGLSQKMDEQVVSSIESQGIDVVRRPTGGRAVLHLNDFTYSFVGCDTTKDGGFLSTSVTESYRQICEGLMAAFAELGIRTEIGASGVAYRHLQDCFMATAGSDLQHDGTKLIGSAQVRRRGGVLQHGSVPLNQDPALMPRLLGETVSAGKRHLNLFDLTGRELTYAQLEEAFRLGFEKAFGVTLLRGELTARELRERPLPAGS